MAKDEKERNNKHIRILLEVIAMVALCVAGFVTFRGDTKVNTINIEKNGKHISENGTAIKELLKMRGQDREEILEARGEIEVKLEGMSIKQEVMSKGIERIEKKL